MRSTAKRLQISTRKYNRHIIREGIDEESNRYFTNLGGPVEKRSKMLQPVSLGDIPVEVRRKEAKKALYLIRYE
jgi:hypothetical protein